MAEELRSEVLSSTLADGTQNANAAAEFRNDSSRMLFVRQISWAHKLDSAGPAEGAYVEVSKSPTFTGRGNNNVFFTLMQCVGAQATGATPADGDSIENGKDKWSKGQVTLEPNESLFINITKDQTGGGMQANYVLYYHF